MLFSISTHWIIEKRKIFSLFDDDIFWKKNCWCKAKEHPAGLDIHKCMNSRTSDGCSHLRGNKVMLAVCNVNFMSGQIIVKFEAYAITFLFPFAVQITCVLRHQKHEHAFLFSPLRLLLWILEILVVCSQAYISRAFDSNCLTWTIYIVLTSLIILPQYFFVLLLLQT